jgi:hypothetical protein
MANRIIWKNNPVVFKAKPLIFVNLNGKDCRRGMQQQAGTWKPYQHLLEARLKARKLMIFAVLIVNSALVGT